MADVGVSDSHGVSGPAWQDLQEEGAAAAERGEFKAAHAAYEQAIRVCRSGDNGQEALAALFGDLGDTLLEAGETDKALDAYKESLSRHQTDQHLLGIAVSHRRLGSAYQAKGDPDRAADSFDEADSILRRVDDDGERATLHTRVGELHEESGRYHKALDSYRKALAINQARDDREGVILCLRLVGSALQEIGDLSGAAEHLNRALVLLEDGSREDSPELIEVTNLLGSVLEDQGELSDSLELFKKSLELATTLEHEPARAETLQHMGSVYRHRGDLEEAIDCVERAIRISKGLKDDVALSKLYGDLGDVYVEKGDPEEAIVNYKEALYRDQAHQDLLGMAVNQRRLGFAYQARGEWERADDCYEEAESLLRRLEDEGERAILFANRGSLHEELGEYEKALAAYSKALAINEAQRHDVGTIICLRHLGSALLSLGDLTAAAQHLERALVLIESHDDEDTPELIEVSNLLGSVHEGQGRPEDALVLYRRSLDLAEKLEHEPLKGQSLRRIGSAECLRGNYVRALERYEAAVRIWKELDDDVELAEVSGDIGKLYEDQRQFDLAVRHYTAGLRIARRLELPPAIMRLALGLSRCHRQLREPARVADILEEVQEIIDVDSAPLRAEFWLEVGRFAEAEDRIDEAIDDYQKALDFFKTRGDATRALECQRLLLHAALLRGDSEQATSYLLEAFALSPDDVRLAWSTMLGQYHPAIAAAAIPAFKVGDYWSAIAQGFVVCEEMLRQKMTASSLDKTGYLIDQWFQPEARGLAPWSHAKELDGFRQFCRGAFEARRNPQSHRTTLPVDATEAVAWLSVTHLIATLMDAPEPRGDDSTQIAEKAVNER